MQQKNHYSIFKVFLKFLLVVTVCFLNTVAFSQSEKIPEQFFKDFKTDKIKAYDNLFANNDIIEKSTVEKVKISYKDYVVSMGEYHGFEEITTKALGESYVLKSYLVKFQSKPVRFTFILYKPNDNWQLQSFAYDEDFGEELGEAAKAYRLKSNW